MNILMMPTWYFEANNPFAGIFTTEQSINLGKNCNVAIYYPLDTTMDRKFSSGYEKELLTYRSKLLKSKIPKISTAANAIRIIKEFRLIKREFKPDLIHAHVANPAGFYAVMLGKIFKIPVIITEHCPSNMLVNSKLNYYMANYAYKNSKYNICVSEYLRDNLKAMYSEINFDVIYNGINIAENIEMGELKETKDKINISFVAGFYNKDIKGMQYLLPAIKKLRGKGYNIILHIVGGGKFQQHYINISKELGIFPICKFYGYLEKEKTLKIVSNTDFMVSSSLTETFGCAIAEALMLGKPVVITNSGGPESFVNDQVGVIVKKESVEELALGIEKMIKNIKKYNNNNILQYAIGKFSMPVISQRYLAIYEKLVNI